MRVLRESRVHHPLGILTITVGASYLFEQYALISRALQAPFSMLDWFPAPISGQQLWGILFIAGGILILVSWNVYVRAVSLIMGALSWGFFGAASLYVSLLSPDASDETGAYAGLLATFTVVLFLWASTRVLEDFAPSSDRLNS